MTNKQVFSSNCWQQYHTQSYEEIRFKYKKGCTAYLNLKIFTHLLLPEPKVV